MSKNNNFSSYLSDRIADTRIKWAILCSSLLFTVTGVLWQEKYISFGFFGNIPAIPPAIITFLFILVIASGFLFWFFKYKEKGVSKGVENETKRRPDKKDEILEEDIYMDEPIQTIDSADNKIAEFIDKLFAEGKKRERMGPPVEGKSSSEKTNIASRLKKDILGILSRR